MMYDSDQRLLQACRQGDARAWDTVLDKYERLVFSIPLNYGLTKDDAADIAQLTFTIFLQSLDGLDDDSNLAGWLATVARRHSWRVLARRRREQVGDEGDLSEELYHLSDGRGERALAQWEQIEWLNQALGELDERCRRLLLALYFSPHSPSYVEIAGEMDMAVGSIGPTRARCLEKLKEYLQGKNFTR